MSTSITSNWTGFIKLLNEHTFTIEAAMCDKCKTIYQLYDDNLLNIHRQTCQGFIVQEPVINTCNTLNNLQMDIDDIGDNTNLTKKDMDRKLVYCFVANNIPFNDVENKFFIDFVQSMSKINYQYTLPCRQTLSSYVDIVYNDIIESKKKLLSNTPSILLVDGWKNKAINRKFLVFSLRNINTHQTFLTFMDFSLETEDGDNLANSINEAIKIAKEKYETDVFAIITDNDSKIKCGGKKASTSDDQPLWQTTCASHSANLLLKSVVVQSFVDKIRAIVTNFRQTKLDALLSAQGGTKLQSYPDTRFCYFRDSCSSILKNLDILKRISMANDVDLEADVFATINNQNFGEELKETITKLDSICKLINKSQDPTCNIADVTEMWIYLSHTNDYDTNILQQRIEKAVWPINYAANILHPKYQGLLLNEKQRKKAFEFFSDYFDAETLLELDDFLNSTQPDVDELMGRCKEPITFWDLSSVFYPRLAECAKKLMIIPASTARLESLFSSWSFIHNIVRNRLDPIKSSVMLDIYYFLRHDMTNMYERT